MNRRCLASISAVTALGLVLVSDGSTLAEQKSLKEQLVGTWTFVSSTDNRWGPNPKGMLMFDAKGHYVLVINRSDLPKIAANRVDQGTAEEYNAVMKGMIVTFGTYSVNEAEKTLNTKIEGGSFPNLWGGAQKRVIKSLTAEQLMYLNPATTIGTSTEVVWKRAK